MLDFIHSHGMIISGMILLISYIFIASEKIQKSVVALVGASLTMLLGLIPLTLNLDSNVKGVFEYVDRRLHVRCIWKFPDGREESWAR